MARKREITCIVCPNGCRLSVFFEGEKVLGIEGHLCKKGEKYAKEEITNPMRNLTSTVLVENGELPLVSVRSNRSLPRDLIRKAIEVLKGESVQAPVEYHQVLYRDILKTGADIIATVEINRRGRSLDE